MVSTIAPDKDNYMAIVMKEKARTRPRDRIYKMPSDLLNFDVRIPNNAQVRIFVSPAVNKTRSHLRSYNSGVALRNLI